MFQKTTLPLHAAPSEVSSSRQRNNLTLADVQSDSIARIAETHFSSWDPQVIENIFKDELEPSLFSSRKLLLLEYCQYLEKFLWPNYDENASLNHVLSICLMVNEKARQNISLWDAFESATSKFASFFQRVIHLMADNQLPLLLRRQVLMFLIQCFQSFENSTVRTECLKLVTIGIWSHLAHQGKRETMFSEYPALEKLWKSSNKKMVAASEDIRRQMEFERDFLSTLMRNYVDLVYKIPAEGQVDQELIKISERYLEFFIDLEAQLPTRRFFNTLLDDHEIVVLSQMAPLMRREDKDVDLIKKLLQRLEFYSKFEINDQTGVALTDLEMTDAHCQQLIQLQHVAFRHFREEIKELPLANLASIETRQDLLWHLEPLSNDVLARLCNLLNLRSAPLDITIGIDTKEFLINVLISKYQKRVSQIETINSQPLYPDENTLFDDSLVSTQFYAGDRPLALPKLNLQFLTLFDYLLRNFTLFKLESSYEIRQDIEDVVKRISPRLTYPDRKTEFAGWARMAVPIQDFNIVDVGEANLGESKPSRVRADVGFNVQKYSPNIRNEWDNLRKHDVLFLLTIEATEESSHKLKDDEDFRQHYGIRHVRGCEIVDIIAADGRAIDEASHFTPELKQARWKGSRRTLRVEMDANQYKMDMDKFNAKQAGDIHTTFNVLVRRKPQENNFKSVLETIRDLMQSDLVVPDWLQRVFLGYGDPASASYKMMPNRQHKVDLRDTFLDFEHLKTCFEGKQLQVVGQEPLEPPYTITLLDDPMDQDSKPTKKSKKSKQQQPQVAKPETLQVSSYKLPNMGPYPQDVPKKNHIRYTPVQAESIYAGMNHGLTMVVGPPGTGKTDVAVQTIANLYRNHPEQHTLIVTHSNQALNQIFSKLIELDVDPRHVVRLGHGEQELDANVSFSKHGRVLAALERRILLLQQVDHLSQSLSVPGAHGSTCETADYFFRTHVLPRWESFQSTAAAAESVQQVRDAFPFAQYFANAPTPIFTETMTPAEAVESATGCFRHLQHIFTQLEELRPFELLRSGYDRANYLVTKEAKIVAMTCTHAALKRRELVKLGFKYDNIVIEEAAQILEIETFIPLLLQEPKDGQNLLKRVMLIGDHHQLPPVIKNSAFQQFCHLEQSMFTRFVRLGVPTLQLDQQGRARPSIADLYNWRYHDLQNLPKVTEGPYTKANAGFAFDYQMIDVGEYQQQGETEPVPYFYQNLGEAEYIVAVYQYMRLVGYPAEKISILTTYNGQKALIKDVLERRCAWNSYFGTPAAIETVDKYQGQQNDYVLLSLVRTKAVGHIRDIRRLIVAMSRAKFGLYVFCNKALFENCYELEPVMKQLNNRPCTLQLVDNEEYPSERSSDNTENVIDIAHVEDMGQLVYKKSQVQLKSQADELALQQQEDASMDTDE
ncbi:intron-binding protein aquarius [Mucor ambiguus]|uniref:Pre-mRNA-splicing factor n=1 Tax=Mucor ambiguus TaxID=91626 RepID=A0A0C9N345_9FUNG|nr:intron-binding protein aquarius [Mucor ambiguus]